MQEIKTITVQDEQGKDAYDISRKKNESTGETVSVTQKGFRIHPPEVATAVFDRAFQELFS